MLKKILILIILASTCVCANAQRKNSSVSDMEKLKTRYVNNCYVVDNCKVTLHDFERYFKQHPEFQVLSKRTYTKMEFGINETYVTSFSYNMTPKGGSGQGVSIELGKAIGIGIGLVEIGLLGSLFLKNLNTSGFSCQIDILAEPEYCGTVKSDYVFYKEGETCTVRATPNNGHRFLYWSENDNEVSRDAYYQFTVTRSRKLKAHFK